eukprot:4606865-Pleurochrysis_carterae.AAC.1
MKRNGRSGKPQKTRPRSRTFAWAYSAMPHDGPRSQTMLVFRRNQILCTRITSSRGRRKLATL